MSNTVYDRLQSLFNSVGLDGAESSVQHAELMAYCGALSLLQNDVEQVLADVFIDTMSERGLLMYCNLLNIESGDTPEETKEKILDRLANGFFTISLDDYRNAEKNVPGLNCNYQTDVETATLDPVSKESMAGLSEFLQNYCPVFFSPEFIGSGLTFDFLDSLDYRWYEIDRLAFTFYLWERLGAAEN